MGRRFQKVRPTSEEDFDLSKQILEEMGYKPFWNEQDPAIVAYGQLYTSILVESPLVFQTRVKEALGRKVDFSRESVPSLLEEFRKKFDAALLNSALIGPNGISYGNK